MIDFDPRDPTMEAGEALGNSIGDALADDPYDPLGQLTTDDDPSVLD